MIPAAYTKFEYVDDLADMRYPQYNGYYGHIIGGLRLLHAGWILGPM